jgi:1-acyl-sn-glycerol-3-phosphate acyltransferase
VYWMQRAQRASDNPALETDGFRIDRSVGPVATYRGGSHAARPALRHFVAKRLRGYAEHRNHPEQDATSRLVEIIADYGRGMLPLVGPLTLVRHYVRQFAIAYLQGTDLSRTASQRVDAPEPRMTQSEPLAVEETLLARWGRRAVTVPLYLLLGTLTVALLPVTMTLALASDTVRRTGHLVTLRCTLAITLYFTCEAVGIVASFVLWVANGLWPGATAERVLTWNLLLQRLWARTLFAGATRLFSMRVEVTGEDAVRRGPLFLFSRHASILDSLLPAVFASQPDTLRLGHVMKRELLWDPCLDIVGQRTRNAFIRRGSDARDQEIALLRQLAITVTERDGVLLFPEGTRFSSAKRERALAHLEDTKQFARLERTKCLQNVLPPHRGGALALLETRPDVDVAFLAHVGFEGTASLNDIWRGTLIGRTIQLCFWRVSSVAIPQTAEDRVEWLDAQWERIDAWISAHASSQPAHAA